MSRVEGVTLIELILAIVVISISVAGLMAAYSSMMGRSADPLVYQQSLTVAEAMMEEISSKPFLDTTGNVCPSPPGGGRAVYNNVCDYDGFSMTTITDLAGNSLSLTGYSVSVAVDQVSSQLGTLGTNDNLRISVTVSNPLGENVVLTSYRTRY